MACNASLHGHYSASSLLPGSPPLSIAFVLAPSWLIPLAASPFASKPRFSCSIRPPLLGSSHLYAGCRPVRKQVPPELIPRSRRRVLGKEHPATLNSMSDLARLYQYEREYDL